jgi:hypothetical protein
VAPATDWLSGKRPAIEAWWGELCSEKMVKEIWVRPE